MFIKRTDFMNTAKLRVKKFGAASLSGLVIATSAMAPNAFANSSKVVDRVVTVKVKLSDLETPKGHETVYSKLKKRAVRFCKADRSSLYFHDETVDECVDDLLTQFVDSLGVSSMTAYHNAQSKQDDTVKLALNMNASEAR